MRIGLMNENEQRVSMILSDIFDMFKINVYEESDPKHQFRISCGYFTRQDAKDIKRLFGSIKNDVRVSITKSKYGDDDEKDLILYNIFE